MQPASHPATQPAPNYVYAQSPLLVYWEMTRACDLACAHCRAAAMHQRDPRELSTAEGKALLRSIRAFASRPPHVVMTGGDALRRPDLLELIAYATGIGVPVALAPSATPLLTTSVLHQLPALGVEAISLSLDGSTPALHDGIRQVPGCWDLTMQILPQALAAGLKVQINTLVTAATLSDLWQTYDLLTRYPILRWSLFALIQVGRGEGLAQIEPAAAEALCNELAERMPGAPFEMKLTEAPHFRRVAVQRLLARGLSMVELVRTPLGRGFGVRDGNGVLFVSHVGDVYPSGFLPLPVGNVREADVVDIYRSAPLLRDLRAPDRFQGRCGRCKYRSLCGGSRARAYAATGDPLGSDPLCSYQPD